MFGGVEILHLVTAPMQTYVTYIALIFDVTYVVILSTQVNLVGGYYDSGDNVKFGFPMAFTITTLSWSVVEFEKRLASFNELNNALISIRWGTDYMIRSTKVTGDGSVTFYGQVGDGQSDHVCWQRPEDMTTPRPSYKIDSNHPGSDLAGETAAALAAASLAFRSTNRDYSDKLLRYAKAVRIVYS